MRRGGDRGLGVADLLLHARRPVARHVVVDQQVAVAGVLDAHHGRQHVVVDADPVDGVLGDVAVDRHDHRDRLADVVDLVAGQGVLGAAVGERGVRDQQRQRLGHRPDEVLVGVDGHDPLDVEDGVDVDREDPGVGVRAAQDGGVQRAGHQVVGVLALPAQQPVVLDALDGLAEELGGHGCSPSGPSRTISAARHTAETMFW